MYALVLILLAGLSSCVAKPLGEGEPCNKHGLCAEGLVCNAVANICEAAQSLYCRPGDTRGCGTSEGECMSGVQACDTDGTWGGCGGSGYVGPEEEDCDGLDNDCDGRTDEVEELRAPTCSLTEGVCRGSIQSCGGDKGWQDCTQDAYADHATSNGKVYEAAETLCDGLDNDCDGFTDEMEHMQPPECENQRGVCAGAIMICAGTGGWAACTASEYDAHDGNYESLETLCDRQDNDCDGETDEITANSVEHCGECGNPCTGSYTECVGGFCHNPDGDSVHCGYSKGSKDRGEMCFVAGGIFTVGCSNGDQDCPEESQPAHDVTLSAYYIDRHEVTNRQYKTYLDDNPDSPAPACSNGSSVWNETSRNYTAGVGEQPVVCVTHEQTLAYCTWAGKSLPTEAQWEAAARGLGSATYPWGEDAPSCDVAVMNNDVDACGEEGADSVLDVCSRPVEHNGNPYDLCDMGGNAWEWVADWYAPYTADLQADPSGPESGDYRIWRGGAWNESAPRNFTGFFRRPAPADAATTTNGFRCAIFPVQIEIR